MRTAAQIAAEEWGETAWGLAQGAEFIGALMALLEIGPWVALAAAIGMTASFAVQLRACLEGSWRVIDMIAFSTCLVILLFSAWAVAAQEHGAREAWEKWGPMAIAAAFQLSFWFEPAGLR